MRIAIVTLGCDKNTVDAEYLAGLLAARGHTVVSEGKQNHLDVLVLMTCGFIEAAREQSLETLLAFCESKSHRGNPRRIVMAGCLAQRFGRDMRPELGAVDAFAGVGQPEALADLVERIGEEGPPPSPTRGRGKNASAPLLIADAPVMRMDAPVPRRALDRAPHAFLKIADGCDHACAFCAIPAIKGPYVSVPREIVLGEARELAARGAKEIVLIAQDLAPYGRDLYDDRYGLPELLEDLCRIDGDFRLRLLYFYPGGLTDRFLEVFAREEKICKYLDIPLQHLDPEILRAMRRPARETDVAGRIAALRAAVPDVVVRTTMIVGFPGEGHEHFARLLAGVRALRFERLGAFVFSPEEGTPAESMPHRVTPAMAERRLDRLMREQAAICLESQRAQIGRTLRVLVEEVERDGSQALGRSYREAPDVDGQVVIELEPGSGAAVGDFVDVTIAEADPYDLRGKTVTGARPKGRKDRGR